MIYRTCSKTRRKSRSLRSAQTTCEGDPSPEREKEACWTLTRDRDYGEREGVVAPLARHPPTLPAPGLPGAPLSHLTLTGQHRWVRTVPLLQPRRKADWGVPAPYPRSGPSSRHDFCHSAGLSSSVAASNTARRLRGCGAARRGDAL